MCGILAWFSENRINHQGVKSFSDALNTMITRGPDDYGIAALLPDGNGFTVQAITPHETLDFKSVALLGQRRLSIIDLSQAGHQPMGSQDGKLWITYNGEVFNYVELKSELEGLGYTFTTQTDTEVILVAYQQWGTNCFRRFNGMWGIVLVDLLKEEVYLSRDHFGIKPVYYVQNQTGFFVASSIRAILELSGIDRRPNVPILWDFLLSGRDVAGAETYVEGVYEVPAAHFLTFALRAPTQPPKQTRWWRIGQHPVDTAEPEEGFLELFEDSVKIRMRSDVCIGSCLSGGLDSSAIVMAMAKQLGSTKRVNTITCCYDGPKYNEEHFARQVVMAANSVAFWPSPEQNHCLSDDLLDLVSHQEKPFRSLSVYSQYCVMREAKEAGVTVLLDGQGGDELLLGYDSCHITRLIKMTRSLQLFKAINFSRKLCRTNPLFSPSSIVRDVGYGLASEAGLHRTDRKVCAFLNVEMLKQYGSYTKSPVYPKDLTEFRYALVERTPLPPLLHHEDRNSMAFSIEARVPMLDYRLADFIFRLPAETLMTEGWSKVFLRRYLDRAKLPAVAWRREKMGYPTPASAMMEKSRSFFQEVCSGTLNSERFINAKRVRGLVDNENFCAWHWRLLSVELWMQSLGVK